MARNSCAMLSQCGSAIAGSTRREEFGVAQDAVLAEFHEIDEFGRNGDAGDLGVNVGTPVRGGFGPLDDQREQGVVAEPKHLDHHGKPGPKFGEAGCPEGDGLVGTGADDFIPALIRKQPAQAGEIAADTRSMQLLNHAFRTDALRHCISPSDSPTHPGFPRRSARTRYGHKESRPPGRKTGESYPGGKCRTPRSARGPVVRNSPGLRRGADRTPPYE